MGSQRTRFTVTFGKDFPGERVDGMLESDFMGWGKTLPGEPRSERSNARHQREPEKGG
jgi:hypothetical protein